MRYSRQIKALENNAIATFGSCIKKALNSLDNYKTSGNRESIVTTHEFLRTAQIPLMVLINDQDSWEEGGVNRRYRTVLGTLYHIRYAEQIGEAELEKISEVQSTLAQLNYQLRQLKEYTRKGFIKALETALLAR